MFRALALSICLTSPAAACETALLLAIDVSGSIDRGEYALQVQGLAAALQTPEIAEDLLRDQVALSVLQWSGLGRQEMVIPWQRMLSARALDTFQQRVAGMPPLKWSTNWDMIIPF